MLFRVISWISLFRLCQCRKFRFRAIGQVFSPLVGGPGVVKNLESSVKTKYDGLLLSVEKRFAQSFQFRASYTLSKAFNYANDDQIPFSRLTAQWRRFRLQDSALPGHADCVSTLERGASLPARERQPEAGVLRHRGYGGETAILLSRFPPWVGG